MNFTYWANQEQKKVMTGLTAHFTKSLHLHHVITGQCWQGAGQLCQVFIPFWPQWPEKLFQTRSAFSSVKRSHFRCKICDCTTLNRRPPENHEDEVTDCWNYTGSPHRWPERSLENKSKVEVKSKVIQAPQTKHLEPLWVHSLNKTTQIKKD